MCSINHDINHNVFSVSLFVSFVIVDQNKQILARPRKCKKKTKQGSHGSRGGIRLNYLPGPSSVEGGDGHKERECGGRKTRGGWICLYPPESERVVLLRKLPLAHLYVC